MNIVCFVKEHEGNRGPGPHDPRLPHHVNPCSSGTQTHRLVRDRRSKTG
jgi:hypothetical protein